jgi:hypothetical protein
MLAAVVADLLDRGYAALCAAAPATPLIRNSQLAEPGFRLQGRACVTDEIEGSTGRP